jgi:hypothetical protein
MRKACCVDVIRRMSSLSAAFPGATARAPLPRSALALSLTIKAQADFPRSGICAVAVQALVGQIGRTSRFELHVGSLEGRDGKKRDTNKEGAGHER